MNITFCELRNKDVINICNGKNLGNITDIAIDTSCGRVTGIIVPISKKFFSFLNSNNDLFIPYNRICKIGQDIILVDIIMQDTNIDNKQIYCCNNNNINDNVQNINIQKILNSIDKNDS